MSRDVREVLREAAAEPVGDVPVEEFVRRGRLRRVARQVAVVVAGSAVAAIATIVGLAVLADDPGEVVGGEPPVDGWELVAADKDPFDDAPGDRPLAAVTIDDLMIIGGGRPPGPPPGSRAVIWTGGSSQGWTRLDVDELGGSYSEGVVEDIVALDRPEGSPVVVAVGASEEFNSAIVWRSEDAGASWTAVYGRGLTIGDTTRLTGIAADPETGELVAVGSGLRRPYGYRSATWRSIDGGSSWTRRPFDDIEVDTETYDFSDIAVGDGREVVVGLKLFSQRSPEAAIWTGQDGGRLQTVPSPQVPSDTEFTGVTFVQGRGFVAYGAAENGQPPLWLSDDGVDWRRAQDDNDAFPAGRRFVIHELATVDGTLHVVGSDGSSAVAWDSTDLTTWTRHTLPAGEIASTVLPYQDRLVVLGWDRNGQLIDGRMWRRRE